MANSARTQSKTITAKQTGQIIDRIATKLRASGLSSDSVQLVLAAPGGDAIEEMVVVFRRHVESISYQIVRPVQVDQSRNRREALEATGRKLYVSNDVFNAMPSSNTNEVVFFKPVAWEYTRPGFINDTDLEKAFNRRKLSASDPFSLAAVNEVNPAFADDHPNATHWKDANGKWCYCAFDGYGDNRFVHVTRHDGDWEQFWWFGGVRKSAQRLAD